MSCRTTAAGSCFTTYARLAAGGRLSDVATLSLFHELRRSYNAQPAESRRVRTREEYDALLNRQETRIRNLSGVSDARRNSMLARIASARSSEMPDQSVLHALYNITPSVRNRVENIERFLNDTSSRLSIPLETLREQFNELSEVDSNRANLHDSITQADRDVISQYGLGQEAGVCHAVSVLNDQIRAIQSATITEGVPRITRMPITSESGRLTSAPNLRLVAAGYDARNHRLEVEILNTEDNTTKIYAYCNVSDYTGNQIANSRYNENGRTWYNSIRGNVYYQYATPEQEALAGLAPRCLACGQFAASEHTCPMVGEVVSLTAYGTSSRWSKQKNLTGEYPGISLTRTGVRLPAITEFRNAFSASPVKVTLSEYIYSDQGYSGNRVRGDLTAYRDSEGNIKVNTSNLVCSCEDYQLNGNCIHTKYVGDTVKLRLDPPRTIRTARTPEERATALAQAQAIAMAASATDWMLKENTMREAKKNWIADSEISYSEDFDTFREVFESALKARKDNDNKPVIPYIKENALDGMATRASGQGFGVEIEYEFPPGMNNTAAANRQIGIELHTAGLTNSPSQLGYHAAGSAGYKDTHKDADGKGTWSWERDGSVNGGELVTPTMYDEPETWENLEKAIEILTRNGAVATKKAGGHVHVGTGFYNGSVEKYTELARLMTQHEDVLFRLAANPVRGTHRQSSYVRPINEVPATGFANIANVQRATGRGALNYGHVSGTAKDHPEFRIFDSSLNAGAIQAHIKLSVAMTHAAARIAADGGTKRTKEVLGSHSDRTKAFGRGKLTPENLKSDTATFRSLLDTLFKRKEDKDQLVTVFANTKWSAKRR